MGNLFDNQNGTESELNTEPAKEVRKPSGSKKNKNDTAEQDHEVEYRFNVDDKNAAPRKGFEPRLMVGTGILTFFIVVMFAFIVSGAINRINGSNQTTTPGYVIGGGNSLNIAEVPENSTPPLDKNELTSVEIVNKASPSVVGITTYVDGDVTPVSSASGIIMSADGLIITNGHVVASALSVNVSLPDGTQHIAEVVGIDKRTDLAVLRIDASNLVAAIFGDSGTVMVGEKVLVIGNPGGLYGSTSQGIVSGINRQVIVGENTEAMGLLQTDAAINPGVSGGALVNRYGQVIGICTAKVSLAGYEGIGFAIPITEAKPIVDNLVEYGYVKDRAVLGVTVSQLNEAVGQLNDLPTQGLYIMAIEEYSPLLAHGVVVGDILVKAEGQVLVTNSDLLMILKQHLPEDVLELLVYKKDTGKIMTVHCKLVAATE